VCIRATTTTTTASCRGNKLLKQSRDKTLISVEFNLAVAIILEIQKSVLFFTDGLYFEYLNMPLVSASPRLWNQLPAFLRQPRTNLSNFASPSSLSGTSSISYINSPLSSSITPSLFHSRLKTFFSANPSHCCLSFSSSGLTTWSPWLLRLLLA